MEKDVRTYLWDNLKYLFVEDDGSLPEIYVQFLDKDEIIKIIGFMLSVSLPQSRDKTFWSTKKNADIPLIEVENPAVLLFDNEIESGGLDIEVYGVNISDSLVPDVNCTVYRDELEIYYRKGSEWDKNSLYAFFEFLSNLIEMTKKGHLLFSTQCEAIVSDEDAQFFGQIFSEYYNHRR